MVGEIIRKLREDKSITQSKLGEMLNLSPSTIGMYEQNRRLPDIDTLIQFCNLFCVSSDYLLGITDSPAPHKPSNSTDTLQGRIISLMKDNDLDIDFISAVTKIRKQRLEDIIKDKKPDINELIVLAECLGESTDYLLRLTDEASIHSQKKFFSSSDNINFAKRLQMEIDGLYLEAELAEELNVPISTVRKLLYDQEIPTPEILANISQLLKKSTDYMLGLSETSKEPDSSGRYPFNMDGESIKRLQNIIGDNWDEHDASALGLNYEEFYIMYHFGFIPHISVLQKICKFYHVSSDYILNLSNSKLCIKITEECNEDQLINNYRKLDTPYQQKINGVLAEQLLQQERDEYMRLSVAADETLKKSGTDALGK